MNKIEVIRQFIIENNILDNGIKPDNNTKLFQGGLTSAKAFLELVLFIEERFGITFNEEELISENFNTLGKIESSIRLKTS